MPEVFKFVEQSLDCIAQFVKHSVAWLRASTIMTYRYDRCHICVENCVVEMLCIIDSVCNHVIWGKSSNEACPELSFSALPCTWYKTKR